MRRSHRVALGLLVLSATSAHAQPLPSVDTRTWIPSTDPHAQLATEPVATGGAWAPSFALATGVESGSITLRYADTGEIAHKPLRDAIRSSVLANLGIGDAGSIGVQMPIGWYQTSSSGLPTTVSAAPEIASPTLGDASLHGKFRIKNNEDGGLGAAVRGAFFVPTGDRQSFMGEGASRVELRAIVDYSLVVLRLQAQVGYRARTAARTWPDASLGGIRFGDEMPWAAGIVFKPGTLGIDPDDRQRWEIGARGWLPVTPVGPFGAGSPGSSARTPVMLSFADRIAFGQNREVYAMAGVDIGLSDAIGVPALRGVLTIGWAPREHDRDHDGVPDEVDACPEIPEDRDGFEDDDGCPEIDDDDDGIIDVEDRCPREPGPDVPGPRRGCPTGDRDGDGVPDALDACPDEKGQTSEDPKLRGCPAGDRDGDGIPDAKDKCPDQPEDKDGFQDDDGCPDPDNDGDGVADAEDACPMEVGEPSNDPSTHGCPIVDHDGDGIVDAQDSCPDQPEVYNGVDDDDGCPDQGGAPLVQITPANADRLTVRLKSAMTFGGTVSAPEVAAVSLPTLRAIALELHSHPRWTLIVGGKPLEDAGKEEGPDVARAASVVDVLSKLVRRSNAVELVTWKAVERTPEAKRGVGFSIVEAPKPPVEKAQP